MSVIPTANGFKKAHTNAQMCVFRRLLHDSMGHMPLGSWVGCGGFAEAVGSKRWVGVGGLGLADTLGLGWGLGGGGDGVVKFVCLNDNPTELRFGSQLLSNQFSKGIFVC